MYHMTSGYSATPVAAKLDSRLLHQEDFLMGLQKYPGTGLLLTSLVICVSFFGWGIFYLLTIVTGVAAFALVWQGCLIILILAGGVRIALAKTVKCNCCKRDLSWLILPYRSLLASQMYRFCPYCGTNFVERFPQPNGPAGDGPAT